jgi:hypothetical protein
MRALLCLCLASCAAAPEPAPPPDDGSPRVLFIGNSLTYVNDLPDIVRRLAVAAGVQLTVQAVTLPGASIGDHLADGAARKRLRERWSFVVMQQGPTSRPGSRDQFRVDGARMASLIRKAGARPALYMVWPVASEPQWWDGVRESYLTVAREVDGLFLPAGEAWRIAARLDPEIALYAPDGLHPTPAGSYVAALVIFCGLTGHSPLGAPPLPGMPPEVAETLQRAADEALRAAQ